MHSIFHQYLLITRQHQSRLAFFLSLIFLSFSQALHSQSGDVADTSRARLIREEIVMTTDRDLYISGEEVWFSIFQLNSLTHSPWDLSKVVYVELLDTSNYPVVQVKVMTDGARGSSAFDLPGNIGSGNYVLRAYTSWMRTWPPELYFHKVITVINPFESIDHLFEKSGSSVIVKHDPVRQADMQDRQNSAKTGNDGHVILNVTADKTEYSPREKIRITMKAADSSGKPAELNLSLSVVKSVMLNGNDKRGFQDLQLNRLVEPKASPDRYLPELEGNLIRGQARIKSTGEPISGSFLSLAYVGKTAKCQFTRTDSSGRFSFIGNTAGTAEIVIQPLSQELQDYYVELDQPFSDVYADFQRGSLSLDTASLTEINRAVISSQVNNIYKPYRQTIKAATGDKTPDFYGKPERTVRMEDYIELTTVREVVKEIMPNVYTLRQNGRYELKLINKFRGQPFENKPLLLVDGVPVYDVEKVLAINSRDIEKADIINTRYFYAENVFDGIISFTTRKGNLGVIEFDYSTFRQAYSGYAENKIFSSPDYEYGKKGNDRLPDYRNTLYWIPEITTGSEGSAESQFHASDESDRFTVIAEGITPDGTRVYATTEFSVK